MKLFDVLEKLPERSYSYVLRAIVRYLNASVIGHGQQMIRELKLAPTVEASEHDPEESVNAERFIPQPGEEISIDRFNNEMAGRSALNDQYLVMQELGLVTTNRPTLILQLLDFRQEVMDVIEKREFQDTGLELSETMTGMTSGQVFATIEQMQEVCKVVGKDNPEVTPELLYQAVRLDTLRQAAQLRPIKDEIIRHVDALAKDREYCAYGWAHLPEAVREQIFARIYTIAKRAQGFALRNMARMDLDSFGDYTLIKTVIKELRDAEDELVGKQNPDIEPVDDAALRREIALLEEAEKNEAHSEALAQAKALLEEQQIDAAKGKRRIRK